MQLGPKAVRKVLLGIAVTVGLGFSTTGCSPEIDETGSDLAKEADATIAAAAYAREDVAELTALADQGHAPAQNLLGEMYYYGKGVTMNDQEAAQLYKLAADQGNADGQYNLGSLYFDGQGVTQNKQEAVRLYRLAANQGQADAQFNLSGMYGLGREVKQNYTLAHMWANLAASSHEDPNIRKHSAAMRDEVAGKMTPAQIDRAQSMARVCQASNFKKCGY